MTGIWYNSDAFKVKNFPISSFLHHSLLDSGNESVLREIAKSANRKILA